MAEIHTTIMKIAISTGDDAPAFGETAVHVEIDDDAGGPYIVLSTPVAREEGGVAINPDEWPAVKAAVERLLVECAAINRRGV